MSLMKTKRFQVIPTHLPASFSIVGYQSVTCNSSLHVSPFLANSVLCTNPTPLTPPSQTVPFFPRNGQLYPPYTGLPPLSVLKIKTVSFHNLEKRERFLKNSNKKVENKSLHSSPSCGFALVSQVGVVD